MKRTLTRLKKLFPTITATAVLMLCFSLFAAAQDRRIAQIDSLFTSLHDKGPFNGNVLIAEKGKPVYEKSFGYANFNTKEKLTAEHIFELASCSKQFTACAIALLQHQGKLKYSDDITRFIPQLSAYKGITVMDLVHHTSGLPDYMTLFDSLWDKSKIANNDDIITLFAKHKPTLEFQPGTRFQYSNTGYALLASVIEKASGMSYGKYLEKNIFVPLQMKHTFVYNRRYKPKKVPKYAFDFLYDKDNNKYVSIDSVPEANMVYWLDGICGDGTVNTTARDLLLWDRALYTDKLLPAKEKAVLFTSGTLKDSSSTGYGFGWMVNKDKDLGNVLSHSGGWGGYATFIERETDKDRTIIILQNTDRAIIPGKTVRYLLDGRTPPAPVQRKEIKLADDILKQYTGTYELSPEFKIDVTLEGNQLYAQATGQQSFPIFPESEQKFFLKVVDAQMEFFKDATGAVSKAVLYQNGHKTDAMKVK